MNVVDSRDFASRSLIPLRLMGLSIFVALATGCAGLTQTQPSNVSKSHCECSEKEQAGRFAKPATASEQRQILNEGYSMLRTDAKKLNLMELILYAKSESQPFKDAVTDVANFGSKVEKDMERIAKDYPAVRIDLDPLPVMEKRKRFDIGKDRVIDFVPGVGKGGREYERTVLIALMNGINHQSHLCEVMAKEEPNASLKKFLTDTQQGYETFYKRIEAMLNRDYFK